MALSSRRFKSFYVWLIAGVLFYLIDCLIATSFAKSSLDLPWFERGIYAGGPFGLFGDAPHPLL
jgi:hypothetical protein